MKFGEILRCMMAEWKVLPKKVMKDIKDAGAETDRLLEPSEILTIS